MPSNKPPRKPYRPPVTAGWDDIVGISNDARSMMVAALNISQAIRAKMASGEAFDRAAVTTEASALTDDIVKYRGELEALEQKWGGRTGFIKQSELSEALRIGEEMQCWISNWTEVVFPRIASIQRLLSQ